MTSTVFFKNKPSVIATSTVGGPKEGEGQLGRFIEKISEDDTFGEKTYEKAECKMISFVIDNVIKNAKMKESDINAIISGDLLNQRRLRFWRGHSSHEDGFLFSITIVGIVSGRIQFQQNTAITATNEKRRANQRFPFLGYCVL